MTLVMSLSSFCWRWSVGFRGGDVEVGQVYVFVV